MITNIVDKRENEYLSENLDVYFEPSWQDNGVQGATQFDPGDPNINMLCQSIYAVSIAEAIEWANDYNFPVTMYLYDHQVELGTTVRDSYGKIDKTKLFVRR